METKTYRYKAKPFLMLMCFAFFAVCTVVLAHMASTNDRGLILNRIFEFSVSGASTFYWVLTVASACLAAAGIYGVLLGLKQPTEVIVAAVHITAQPSPRKEPVTVQFQDIVDIRTVSVSGQKFLEVYHTGGKLTLQRQMFENKDAFEDCCAAIFARLNTVQ